MIRITNEQVREGKIDHIDIGNATKIDCYGCTSLIELPNWYKVTVVNCSGCTSLTSLPNWPNVIQVSCWGCTSLTSLPNWPKVIELYCSRCPVFDKLGITYNPDTISNILTGNGLDLTLENII